MVVLRTRKHSKYFGVLLLLVVILAGIPMVLFFQEPPTEEYEECVVPLPQPDVDGSMPLSTAMRDPGFSNTLRDYQMKIGEISQLLWAVQGMTHGRALRAIPSAGGTYPLELFVVQVNDSDLEEGYYHYTPQDHQLEGVNITISRDRISSAFGGDDRLAVSNVSTVFFILAEYSRTTDRYRNRGVQYVHLETGHAVQNFLLQLTSLGLKTRPITNFVAEQIQVLLNTSYIPLVALPVGLGNDILQASQDDSHFHVTSEDESTLEQAIAKRKSTREYTNGTLPFTVLSDILNDARSITYLECSSSLLDVRVVVGEVDELSSGSYNYWTVNGSFTLISPLDLREELMTAGLNQPWIEAAQLDVVISVDSDWIDTRSDPSFAHQMAMINVGMMAQNICLKCAAYNLGTVTVGAFYENDVSTVIDLPSGFKPIYVMPMGLTSEFVG
jgi:SagB-type dehydrogenase family enzyme